MTKFGKDTRAALEKKGHVKGEVPGPGMYEHFSEFGPNYSLGGGSLFVSRRGSNTKVWCCTP